MCLHRMDPTYTAEQFLRDCRDEKRRESLHEVQPFAERSVATDAVPDENLPGSPTAPAPNWDHESATD